MHFPRIPPVAYLIRFASAARMGSDKADLMLHQNLISA